MIEEEAYVAEVADGQVWLEKSRKSACSGCAEVCASAWVDGIFSRQRRIPVASSLPLRPGDRVSVGIADDAVALASFWIYLLPLFALFGGALLGQYALGADWASAVGGLAGLALSYVGIKAARLLDRDDFRPVILRKID